MREGYVPNTAPHENNNTLLDVLHLGLKPLGYQEILAVEPGHKILYQPKTKELVLADQLDGDLAGDLDGIEIWVNLNGLEDLGIFNKAKIEAITHGEAAKAGYPDWRMFDKGYYQAINKIRPDWEGFIKILKENEDDESCVKALVAKYAIPEEDAQKLLELTIEKIALLGDKCAEEKPLNQQI